MNKLLVISQESLSTHSWISLLSQRGYHVTVRGIDGRRPPEHLDTLPNFIIFDIDEHTPMAEGLDALDTVREALPAARVLVLSPRSWTEAQTRLLRRRADAQLLKPTDYATLLRLVDMLALQRQPVHAAATSESPLRDAAPLRVFPGCTPA